MSPDLGVEGLSSSFLNEILTRHPRFQLPTADTDELFGFPVPDIPVKARLGKSTLWAGLCVVCPHCCVSNSTHWLFHLLRDLPQHSAPAFRYLCCLLRILCGCSISYMKIWLMKSHKCCLLLFQACLATYYIHQLNCWYIHLLSEASRPDLVSSLKTVCFRGTSWRLFFFDLLLLLSNCCTRSIILVAN